MMPLPPAVRTPDGGFRLALEPGLPAWDGHFPGDPVLPGVLQVDWAVRFGIQAFGSLGRFAGLDQLKFLAPIRPGCQVELHLDWDAGKGTLAFRYLGAGGRLASGLVRFQPGS
jgi:hypothetical protein